jgi:hypothetical protein
MPNFENYIKLKSLCDLNSVKLIAVSKRKSIDEITALCEYGHLDFGENRIQELREKAPILRSDIKWHFIGHLQTNKVKYIAEFVYLIHGVDTFKLLKEINKQALKHSRVIDVLLQYHIAEEEAKFGFSHEEVLDLFTDNEFNQLNNIRIRGVMGMATNSENKDNVKNEFFKLKTYFDEISSSYINNESFDIISMGMSGDYELAIECGSNMIRIGSLIFGARD